MTLDSSSTARFRPGLLGEDAVDSSRKARDSARQEITTGMRLSDRMQRAMRPLRRHLGAVRAVLFVADIGQRTLRVEAVYRASPKDFRARYASGVAGRVAEAGHPIVVPSVRREPMALDELANPASWPQEEELSLVSVPVALGSRGLGALSVYFTGPRTEGFAASLGALRDLASEMAQGLTEQSSEAASVVPSEAPGRAVFEYANMIGASALMRQVYEEIGQVAQTTATALILGESGTG
ncbi:MAG: GAF domain-containing protein, partial [Myxococcota bacterium]|nr:GAF domain-containing protein [Myxococcota bacterium]